MSLGLTTIILTKNEEKNILDCIESVLFSDEIIVVDDYSEDRTVDVLKTYILEKKVIIIKRKLEKNDFSEQRNFGLDNAKGNWILFIDADERVSKELKDEILSLVSKKDIEKFNGYYIRRKDYMLDKSFNYGEISNLKLLRLARRNAGEWKGKVHEEWHVTGKVRNLKNYLIHYPHPTINEFIREINFYSDIKAKELYDKEIKVKPINIIMYPLAKFLVNYFIKLGFLDGTHGFVFAAIMSFHSFLVRGKLWILWAKN